jgi:hypothetical protein
MLGVWDTVPPTQPLYSHLGVSSGIEKPQPSEFLKEVDQRQCNE